MAKIDESGMIEKHIEKIILAATLVLLVAVVGLWAWESPRRIELPGSGKLGVMKGEYSPDAVDAELQRRAEALRERRTVIKLPPPEQTDLAGELEKKYATPYDSRAIISYGPLTSGRKPIPTGGPTDVPKPDRVKLADLRKRIPMAEDPKVNIVHEVVGVAKRDANGQVVVAYEERVAAHGVAVFDHGKLRADWKTILDKSRIAATFVVMNVEVERRSRTPGGPWSKPEIVRRTPIQLPVIPEFTGLNRDEVRRGVMELSNLALQTLILQPDYDDVYDRGQVRSWQYDKPRTRVSDVTSSATVRTPRGPMVTPGRGYRPGVPYGPDGMGPDGPMIGPDGPYGPYVPRVPTPAPLNPGVQPGVPGAPVVPAAPAGAVPNLQRQLDSKEGILEIWFHDAGLAVGVEYQYCARLTICNPMVGFEADVSKPEEAKVLTLTNAWSGWSDASAAPRLTEFFLVGGWAMRGQGVVEVFTRRWGRAVSERFNVHRGEAIGGSVPKTVAPPNSQAELVDIDFATGAVVVDFDFDRKVLLPNSTVVSTTTELVYLDAEGKLRTRVVSTDRSRTEYDAWRAEIKAAAGPATPAGPDTPRGPKVDPNDPRYRRRNPLDGPMEPPPDWDQEMGPGPRRRR